MASAAYDFLLAMSVAVVCIIGGVFYCRHRKRQMRRMGMGMETKRGGRSSGPRPPPWPPGRGGVARSASRSRRRIDEQTPLYSIAEDYGSSEEEDEYTPAVSADADMTSGGGTVIRSSSGKPHSLPGSASSSP